MEQQMVVPQNAYQGIKVFVAVPSHDKKLFMNCHQSLMNAIQVLVNCGIPFQFCYEVGLPYISMARNNLVRKFMQSDCTDLVFIDADVGFAPGAFHDLVIAAEEVIGGAYPKKQDAEEYAVRLTESPEGGAIMQNGVLQAEGLATGFLKIKRSAIEKMEQYHFDLWYDDGMTGQKTFNWFGEFMDKRRIFYDDYGFCSLWARTGGQMWVLPDITFTHAGGRNYEGNLHQYLTRPRPAGIVKALKISGYMTEQELYWLYETAQRMESVVEIGSWKGRSTTALLGGCPGVVLAVDNWTGHDPSSNGILERQVADEDVYHQFCVNTGGFDNPKLRIAHSGSADAVITHAEDTFDMVFIDAEHTYEGCKADIDAWLPKARKIICGHDFSNAWPGVMQAVNERFGVVKTCGTIWYKEL